MCVQATGQHMTSVGILCGECTVPGVFCVLGEVTGGWSQVTVLYIWTQVSICFCVGAYVSRLQGPISICVCLVAVYVWGKVL